MKKRAKFLAAFLACVMVVTANAGIALATEDSNVVQEESAIAPLSAETMNDSMKMWYTKPANVDTAEGAGGAWMQQSLPLGNGNLGNLVFGGVAKERVHFNEKTLWTGGPSASRPTYNFGLKDTPYTAAEIEEYRQILDNHSTKVFPDYDGAVVGGGSIRFPGASNPNKGSYQDFGDIWLDYSAMGVTDANVSDYRRELDLQTGIASTRFAYKNVSYTREHFVSSPDDVMVTYLSASEKGKMNVGISMKLNNSGLSGTTTLDEANNACTIEGKVNDNGLAFRTTMKIIPVGGSVVVDAATQSYRVKGADSIMIVMAAETDYKNDFPVYRDTEKNLTSVVDGRVQKKAAKAYSELKGAHIADHRELFDRVSLDLGERLPNIPTDKLVDEYRAGNYSTYLETLTFQYGRYLSIAGSRGELPSNLVGLWTIGASAWTGDYHFNVNVQMNYWPVYVTNLAECGSTMVNYMDDLREPGRLTAKYIHGIENAESGNGFTVHTENNPFGMTAATQTQEYGWNPTGAAWAVQNIWQHYEFTQDESYLKNKIYPIMKEAALFWDNYLWQSSYQKIDDPTSPYDGQDRLTVAPSFSAEQGPTVVGSTYDQSLVWELYNECIQAGRIVGESEATLQKWTDNMQKLDPININATGGVKEWYEETRVGAESGHNKSYAQANGLAEVPVPNSGWSVGHPGEHRHASHLVGLYPGTLINKDNDAYLDAALQSLTERSYYSTGWSKANKVNLWARTGRGDDAYKTLNNLIGGKSAGLQYNLFDSHGTGGGDTMMNGGSPIWQIDGNYGLTAGVAEMLVQSQLGYTQFLPAIPKAWQNGEVHGLKARGNFTIGETWRNGMAETFTVCYEGDGASSEFVGEYANIVNATVTADGQAVTVTEDEANGRISFAAEKGKTYTIDMTALHSDELKRQAQQFLAQLHPDLDEVKKELENAIAASDANLGTILQKAQMMNKLYTEYLGCEDEIYFMTAKDGLSIDKVDSMYNDMRTLKKALLKNTGDIPYYTDAQGTVKEIKVVMNEQMKNRAISFSKESGAVSNGETLILGKNASAGQYEIRYTLDETLPRSSSDLYEAPIVFGDGTTTVRAALFLKEQRVSPVYTRQYTSSGIAISSVTTSVASDWGAEYAKEKMIDQNAATRWASKRPTGDISIDLLLTKEQPVNKVNFNLFVSNNNAIMGFEVKAWADGAWKTVYSGTKMGDINDKVGAVDGASGGYHAYKTTDFEAVTTSKLQLILKAGYTGEPSLYEIEPMLVPEITDQEGSLEDLNAMVDLAKKADRTSEDYLSSAQALKDSFEESILDAQAVGSFTQADMDSREEFLRSRYLRLGFGATDKSELSNLITQAEEAIASGQYTRDSVYQVNKALVAAQKVMDDAEARQPSVDLQVVALQEALDLLAVGEQISTVAPTELSGNKGGFETAWQSISGYMVTVVDEAGPLTYEFTGNRISALTIQANDHGILRVKITDAEGAEVYNQIRDTYATERTEGATLLDQTLPEGTYTVSFAREGKNPGAGSAKGWAEVGTLTIYSVMEETVDRTALQGELDACAGLNEAIYTDTSWTAFSSVLADAKILMSKEDLQTCTTEMEDMAATLATARNALVQRQEADTTELETVLATAQKIAADGYTEESFRALGLCIAEVEAFLNQGPIYAQKDVDAKTAALKQKISGLKADDRVLRELYEANKNKTQRNYTDESWAAFIKALSDAKATLDNAAATPKGVSDATAALSAAIAGLQEKQGNGSDEINKVPEGESIRVPVDANGKIPADALESAKGRDVDLVIDYGTYSWTVNGKTITGVVDAAGYDLSIKTIANADIAKLSGEKAILQLEIAHNGALPFKATLRIQLGQAYEGKQVYLYYFNETGKTLEYQSASTVQEGFATFEFTHCSKYVITAEKITTSSGGSPTKTGDVRDMTVWVMLAIVATAVLGGATAYKLYLKKRMI